MDKIRTLSPDCEIDAGDLPVHWLTDVKPAESVALLNTFATQRERYMDGAMIAIALHSDPAADAALQRFLAPNQPESIRAARGELVRFDARAARLRRAQEPDRQRPQRARPRARHLHAGATARSRKRWTC